MDSYALIDACLQTCVWAVPRPFTQRGDVEDLTNAGTRYIKELAIIHQNYSGSTGLESIVSKRLTTILRIWFIHALPNFTHSQLRGDAVAHALFGTDMFFPLTPLRSVQANPVLQATNESLS